MILSFTVPALPHKPGRKPRPRTWQRTNHYQGKRLTDKEQRAEKRRIAMYARQALPKGWPTDKAYAVEVVGYWPDRVFGDTDRLVSLTLDALEGVTYGKDRAVSAICGGRFVDPENPRTEVTVVPYDEDRVRPVITIELVEVAGGKVA